MKKLAFSAVIGASRETVWDVMLAPATYQRWTAAFSEGSRFEGSRAEGSRILFLGPGGDGMVSEVAESRRPESLSLRHLGMIRDGVEDTTSEAVKGWVGARESYRLSETGGATELQVDLDVAPDFEEYMLRTWPIALGTLKEICEAKAGA